MIGRTVAVVFLSIAGGGFFGHQDPPNPEKPTAREAELLKDLVEATTIALGESVDAYSGFLSALRSGSQDEKVWLPFARRKALEYLDRGGMLTHDPDLNRKRVEALVAQFAQITKSLAERQLGLLISCDEELAAREGHLLTRLSAVGTSLGQILKKHEAAAKAASIDLSKLTVVAKTMMDLVNARQEAAKKVKTVKLVTILGNKGWQDSEIKAREGERVTVAAVGFVSGGSAGSMSPLGIDSYKDDRVLKEALYGSLIARQEGMERGFYKIGLLGTFEADRTGLLFLMPNYSDFGNKSGYFQAIVVVEKRQKKDDDE